ncbi:hypothetical protein AGMMS50239_23120 [Bacteroidia bacterium]|nr:hypothetical protein AGMMS50239_23120 [Bacteroidia bacterium]
MQVRDKLNTLEGYKTRIKELKGYIEKGENDIKALKESEEKGIQLYPLPNNQVIQNKNKTILNYKFIIFITAYSMGESIERLRTQYSSIVFLMEKSWKKSGGYVDMIWMLSIGIMLDIEDAEIAKLAEMVKGDNPKDYLIDFLIHSRISSWGETSDKFMFKLPYQTTKEIISLSKIDKDNGLERLKKYLAKEWYRGHSSSGWYDSHKHGIIHYGYWSFESGALVKILGLDDSSLKNMQYYPYDMVHGKEENAAKKHTWTIFD